MNKELESFIRPHFLELQGYISAGMESGKNEHQIFMNANENPFELPGLEGYNRYPEPQPPALLESYANLYNIRPDQICMTRGADEAIMLLTRAFCEPHQDAVITHSPTFGIYKVDAHGMPARSHDVPLIKKGDTFALNAQGIIEAASNPDNKIKLVFLCSPNNPTGTAFDKDLILDICESLRGKAVVVVDETYAEFAPKSSVTDQLNHVQNLIVLRTLSKSYALAGMRMGTILCGDPDFITLMQTKVIDIYPLPRGSVDAALKVMSPETQKIAQANIQKLIDERERLKRHLQASDLVKIIYQSHTNFLLVEMTGAQDFVQHCKENGIILRDFSNKIETRNCIRISIDLPENNDRLIKLLMEFEKNFQIGSAA